MDARSYAVLICEIPVNRISGLGRIAKSEAVQSHIQEVREKLIRWLDTKELLSFVDVERITTTMFGTIFIPSVSESVKAALLDHPDVMDVAEDKDLKVDVNVKFASEA